MKSLCFVLILYLQLSFLSAKVKVVGKPVVFTNGAGGGEEELEALPDKTTFKLFDADGRVLAAWWIPFDNISHLTRIHRIETVPWGNQVNLSIQGLPGQTSGRVRIKILAEVLDEAK